MGPVSILVNNAGVSAPATLDSYDATLLDRMRAVNVNGVTHTVRAVMVGMKARGYGRIDAGKKISARKRHLVVDTIGLLIAAIVHRADIQDLVHRCYSQPCAVHTLGCVNCSPTRLCRRETTPCTR